MKHHPNDNDYDSPGAGPVRGQRTWSRKFANAVRGTVTGIKGQSSFAVHFLAAAIVIVAAALLRVTLIHWCLLVLCIGIVLATELINSALEWTVRAITDQYDDRLKRALDIASGAVLLVALTAATAGVLVFLDVLLFGKS